MIFIMVGAMMIVMTEVFILNDKAPDIKWWDSNQQSASEYAVNVNTLRERHESFLQNGIEIPDTVTADNALPQPFRITNDYVFEGNQEIIDPISKLTAIEPAVGTDTTIENKTAFRTPEKSKKIDEVILNLQQDDYKTDAYYAEVSVSLDKPDEKIRDEETIIYTAPKASGKIAIVIDDMGLSLRSRLIEVMDGPLTLSYLPYAEDLQKNTKRAAQNGHELMVHMPMEPMSKSTDPGPHALKTNQSKEQLIKNIRWNLSQFDGFVGVNNHMGSRMTTNQEAMNIVMSELKKRNLFFIDSRTISSSVAAETARTHGIAFNERDIFLDHEISKDFITGALKKLEEKAHKQGYAIAIGHPHKETIDALKDWIPTLKGKGLTLVKASEVLMHPNKQNGRVLEVRATTP